MWGVGVVVWMWMCVGKGGGVNGRGVCLRVHPSVAGVGFECQAPSLTGAQPTTFKWPTTQQVQQGAVNRVATGVNLGPMGRAANKGACG